MIKEKIKVKRKFQEGDLVIAYKRDLGVIVELAENGWYHYYKINNKFHEVIFNDVPFKNHKFKGVYFGFDSDFKLIERNNTDLGDK